MLWFRSCNCNCTKALTRNNFITIIPPQRQVIESSPNEQITTNYNLSNNDLATIFLYFFQIHVCLPYGRCVNGTETYLNTSKVGISRPKIKHAEAKLSQDLCSVSWIPAVNQNITNYTVLLLLYGTTIFTKVRGSHIYIYIDTRYYSGQM